MAPLNTTVPLPLIVKPEEPEKTPDKVATPSVGAKMLLDVKTVNAWLELSLLFKTRVPPLSTGVADTPIALNGTLMPLLIEVLQGVQAVMINPQMLDAILLRLKVYEYPLDMPLKLVTPGFPSCSGVIPVKTDVKLVLMIDVLVVDSVEIPKFMRPFTEPTVSCP